MTKPKRLPKIQKERYFNTKGAYRHDNADVAFEKPGRVKKEEKEEK